MALNSFQCPRERGNVEGAASPRYNKRFQGFQGRLSELVLVHSANRVAGNLAFRGLALSAKVIEMQNFTARVDLCYLH